MVEERANLDYGLDDRPIDEAAKLPNDDYLTIDRVEEHEHLDPTYGEVEVEEIDEPSTYGSP